MKRICILFDGTWNETDSDNPTNVVRIGRILSDRGTDVATGQTVGQHIFYYPGVGTGRGSNALSKLSDKLMGGALGWGLVDVMVEAYRDLIFAYEPGDDISIFGFSRGAFTARSMAGFIRASGIPPLSNLHRIPEALVRYVSRHSKTHPRTPESVAFRRDFAPETATSQDEFKERLAAGEMVVPLTIQYLGLWDTVKALGLPNFVPGASTINNRHSFHDGKLSSMVRFARHAISTDERRATFPELPWQELPDVKPEVHGTETAPYQQLWFPGDHGSVGGGSSIDGLSSIALRWIALGARQAGLGLSKTGLDDLAANMNPGAPLMNKKVSVLGRLLRIKKADRKGPCAPDQVSVASLDRFWSDADYRPKTLKQVETPLEGMMPAERASLRETIVNQDGGMTHRPDGTLPSF